MPDHLAYAAIQSLILPAATVAASTVVTAVTVASSVVTVASTAHGLVAGDIALILSVAGAVEVNGVRLIASAPTSGSVTLVSPTSITAYTSGGTIAKMTWTSGLLRNATPPQIQAIIETLRNLPITDLTATLATIFANTTL